MVQDEFLKHWISKYIYRDKKLIIPKKKNIANLFAETGNYYKAIITLDIAGAYPKICSRGAVSEVKIKLNRSSLRTGTVLCTKLDEHQKNRFLLGMGSIFVTNSRVTVDTFFLPMPMGKGGYFHF